MNQLIEYDEKFEKEFWKDLLYEIVSNMDPWDIDIGEVAKRYSEKVNTMKNLNFKIPANVIIVCAVLLRMKAEILKFSDENKNDKYDEEINNDLNDTDNDLNDYVYKKTNEMDINIIPKRRFKGKISVDELINSIHEILKIPDKKIMKKIEEKQIIEYHVDENIKLVMERIYKKIIGILSKGNQKTVKFSEISDQKDKKNFVKEFIALLFLLTDNKVNAVQNESFGEIYLSI